MGSTLLLVLIPKADGGARPVAIANTIVRLAKAYALYLGGEVFTRIFEDDKLATTGGGTRGAGEDHPHGEGGL